MLNSVNSGTEYKGLAHAAYVFKHINTVKLPYRTLQKHVSTRKRQDWHLKQRDILATSIQT